ncbi:MAG TPA: hypothetical protein VNJ08_03205 [Bacteriovoracaceae bacterium]|nr:hypothetical protein [Bacteriovoracaceae bacterium]
MARHRLCAMESPRTAFAKYVNSNFKHHNQYFRGDANSLMNGMLEADESEPHRSFTVKQVFETDDRVALYSQVVKDKMEIAVVHLLRFEDGKISEIWDLGQVVEKDSPNENGIF